MRGRRSLALTWPDPARHDFARFPVRTLPADSVWYRQHRLRPAPDHGAWFFASRPDGGEGEGRFDLTAPHGTCYVASTQRAAVNELIGPDHAARGWVDGPLLNGRVLSRLRLEGAVRAANVGSPRAADFRATRELVTTERYDITQAWAGAFADAGFGGVFAPLRFSPGSARGAALFAAAGVGTPVWRGDPDPRPVRPLVEGYGIAVVDPPSLRDVTVITP